MISRREQQRAGQFAMIEQWQQSGLNQKQFCLGKNIPYPSFHYWYKVFRQQQTAGSGSFVALQVKRQFQPNVELQLADGRRIIFHEPVSADFLKTLIA